MKTLIIIVFGFLLNQNSFGQNLKIELTNKTDFDIDSVAIGSKYVGLLKKNTSIIVETNGIAMQSGSIMGFPKGSIATSTNLGMRYWHEKYY